METKNQININIFEYKKEQVYPVYLSKENYKDHMKLILVQTKTIFTMYTPKNLNLYVE